MLVCDRNQPVARIVPCRLQACSEQEQRLVARGILTPPLKKRPVDPFALFMFAASFADVTVLGIFMGPPRR